MEKTPQTSELISNLPNNVMEDILVRLPLKEAVKTSVLSKPWQYKWVTIPHLVFDNTSLGWTKSWKETRDELFNIIQQILLAHDGPILKFTLSFSEMESCPEIDHLVSLLNTDVLEEFTLKISEGKSHILPLYIFSCQQLWYLSLNCCKIVPPPTFRGFNRLKCVEFFEIVMSSDSFHSFITKCPLLERLTLHGCWYLDSLILDAPNLKFLDFAGGRFKLVRFNNTPLLEKVLIQYQDAVCSILYFFQLWLKALSYLPALDFLDLGRLHKMPLDILLGGPRKLRLVNCFEDQLPSNLNLSVLVLPNLSLIGASSQANFNFLISLIIICPNLRKLKIQGISDIYSIESIDYDTDAARQFLDQKFSNTSFSMLQEVEVLCGYGTDMEMEFLKFLLAKSPVLERLQICRSEVGTAGGKLRFMEKVIQLRHASPRTEVVLIDPDAK